MAKTLFAVVFGYTLPLLVFFIFGYTWYVYTIRLCATQLARSGRLAQAIGYLISCHILLAFSVFSYIRVLTTPPGSPMDPPTPYHSRHPPSSDHLSDPSASDTSDPPPTSRLYNAPTLSSLTTRSRGYSPATFNLTTMEPKPDVNVAITMPTVSLCKNGGQPRFCDHCRCIKPDRAHHCRDCDACVLKMDHHCPWINGCVGFANYKFFFLFVLYTSFYALWILGTTVPEIISAIEIHGLDLDFHYVVIIILGLLFGLLLSCFTVVHLYYILYNRTTIESISDRPYHARVDLDPSPQGAGIYQVVPTEYGEHLWNIGFARNWKSVMGNEAWAWFLPIYTTPGTGLTFPYTAAVYHRFVTEAEKRHSSPMPPLASAVLPPSPSSLDEFDIEHSGYNPENEVYRDRYERDHEHETYDELIGSGRAHSEAYLVEERSDERSRRTTQGSAGVGVGRGRGRGLNI